MIERERGVFGRPGGNRFRIPPGEGIIMGARAELQRRETRGRVGASTERTRGKRAQLSRMVMTAIVGEADRENCCLGEGSNKPSLPVHCPAAGVFLP